MCPAGVLMRSTLFAVVCFAAAGCLSTNRPPSVQPDYVALYGPVPIIKPGMEVAEINRRIGTPGCTMSTGAALNFTSLYCNALCVYSDGVTVYSANCSNAIADGLNPRSTLEDAYLETKLSAGMSARQAESTLGAPKYGVETQSGNVELFYPEHEVIVEYADGSLVRWRKSVTYRERGQSE